MMRKLTVMETLKAGINQYCAIGLSNLVGSVLRYVTVVGKGQKDIPNDELSSCFCEE